MRPGNKRLCVTIRWLLFLVGGEGVVFLRTHRNNTIAFLQWESGRRYEDLLREKCIDSVTRHQLVAWLRQAVTLTQQPMTLNLLDFSVCRLNVCDFTCSVSFAL